MFQFLASELEFHGPKTPYEYFNTINQLRERNNPYQNPILEGEIVSIDPLQFKFYADFPAGIESGAKWRSIIIITIEKTNSGSSFYVRPKLSVVFWIITAATCLSFISSLLYTKNSQSEKLNLIFSIIPVLFIFLAERFRVKKFISMFKNSVIEKS